MAIKINMIPEGERMLKNALINFRNKVADVIMDEAKDKVPVRTGNLQRSIHVENDENASHVIADADYALFVELGTRHQAANPYLVPALQTVARKFNNEFNK
jgi:HK97 gp10 family phage protein